MSQKISFKVEGMHCASCASSIEKEGSKEKGILSCSVNFATGVGTFEVDEKFNLDHFKESVSSLGFALKDPAILSDNEKKGRELLLKTAISGAVALIVIYFSMGPGMHQLHGKSNSVLQLLLTLPIFLLVGHPFVKALFIFFRSGHSNMFTLIGLGTTSAFLYSIYALFMGGEIYFEAVVSIIAYVYLGQLLEFKAKRRASFAMNSLFLLQRKEISLLKDGVESIVPIEKVAPGDTIIVRPGERIGVDGEVTDGESTIDESMMTGEPLPVFKSKGSRLFAGTINGEGRLLFVAKKVGSETLLSQIISFVSKAQESKAPIQRYADRVSSIFVPTVIAISLLTLLYWLIKGESFSTAISFMVAVLVIACPCALGLATPIAVLVATGRAAKRGLLIGGGEAIEKGAAISSIIFDKTGTLTEGKPTVTSFNQVYPSPFTLNKILMLAGSLENYAEHPISKAITIYTALLGDKFIDPDSFSIIPGKGVKGVIEGHEVLVGNRKLMEESSTLVPTDALGIALVSIDKRYVGEFIIEDVIKDEARDLITLLDKRGFSLHLLTGDLLKNGKEVAAKVGIKKVIAEALPETKLSYVVGLQEKGEKVAMIGDGINDAPALAKADLSFAMGGGTDVAMESSDVTIVHGKIERILDFFDLSKLSMKIIKQNLFLSLIYNLICLPLASGIFGISLSPSLAALAMGLSSFSVVMNSLRIDLRREK